MKKYFYLAILLVATQLIYSQVGIGTQTPSTKSILDLTATDKGFLLPRMTTAERTAIAPNTTTDKGMQVFDTTTNSIWYWDGFIWVALGGGASSGDMSNDSWTDVIHDISGDPVIYAPNQVGIGQTGTSPSLYAKLAVASGNQGVLLPKIDLTSSTMDLDADGDSDISNQPVGLLIFNDGSTLAQGYYFWSGTEWRNIYDITSSSPSISSIDCSNAVLTPSTYTSGVSYNGYMRIPYTGGNGAAYSAGSAILSTNVTGLTATLQSGTLGYGSGELVYKVQGTPNASSPTLSNFTIPATFGASSCVAVVGSTGTNVPGVSGSFISKGTFITSTTPADSEFCAGDFCIRYNGNNVADGMLQIKHKTSNIYFTSYNVWGTTTSSTDDEQGTIGTNNTWRDLYDFGSSDNTEGTTIFLTIVNKTTHVVTQYQISAQIIIQADSGDIDDQIFMRIYQN